MPKGYKFTSEQRKRMSDSHKGQIAWNKGTGGCKRGHDPELYRPTPGLGISVCLECKRENGAKYREKNKNKPSYIIRNRVGRYKITVDDYEKLFEFQDGKCAICRTVLDLNNCRIDHNHQTDRVRGLLCVACNSGIGLLKDSSDVVKMAVKYLESNENRIQH